MGFDIQKMMKQAQKMQDQMNSIQDELGTVEISGSSGGGAVVITCDGRGEVKGVKITQDAAEDLETLEELVLAAIKDAHTKANDLAQQKMSSVTQGMKIPGLPF
jgi:nucleoid-associated protein EbfC